MGQKKMIGYMRVSTEEQNEERQRVALTEIGVSTENIYLDKESGKDFERPQYVRMLEVIDSDTVLIIKSIDRLGRNYKELTDQWRIITKEKGADIYVIDMPMLDTRKEKNLIGTLICDIVLALLSYVAENERHNIKQRQTEGITVARANGVKFGRPKKEIPDNFIQIFTLWQEGCISAKEAAEACGISQSTFYTWVKGQI